MSKSSKEIVNKCSDEVDKGAKRSKRLNELQLGKENYRGIAKKGDHHVMSDEAVEYILQSSSAFVSNQLQADTLGCSYHTILYHQQKHKKEITRLREIWLSKLANEPFAHKRIRLQQYQSLYENMLSVYLEAESIKDKIAVSKHLESLLDKSRLEIEGNQVNIKHAINVKYDDPALLDKSKEILDLVQYAEIEE